MSESKPAYVLYLAVIPAYRQECVNVLDAHFGNLISYFSGHAHLVPTVTTGIRSPNWKPVRNVALIRRKALLQVGSFSKALSADNLITDLNPRSISSWLLIIMRRLVNKPTSVWGHLYPRGGPTSRTAGLRTFMRRLANSYIAYDYRSAQQLQNRARPSTIYVAPNALYRQQDIRADLTQRRDSILYVGRLVQEKKVDLLIQGFAELVAAGNADLTLVIVGDGPALQPLAALAKELGIDQSVDFREGLYDATALASIYSRTVVSVSPGYAGLSITQSLGFGVPIIVPTDEPHAPEIELETTGGVRYFKGNDAEALAQAILDCVNCLDDERVRLSSYIRQHYSAEAMAAGIIAALEGTDN